MFVFYLVKNKQFMVLNSLLGDQMK